MTVELVTEPRLFQTSVRVPPGTPAFDRVGAAFGLVLPTAVGETSTAGPHTALWLGPDEWLVVSDGAVPALDGLLLAGERGLVVDVSANRTSLLLSGPDARHVLEKGCPVDLHPRAFGPGNAVTATLARVPVVLWQTAPAAYRILPRTSFAAYVERWLRDAMAEYVAA